MGIRIPESEIFPLWDPEFWALQSSIELKEAGTTGCNLESKTVVDFEYVLLK